MERLMDLRRTLLFSSLLAAVLVVAVPARSAEAGRGTHPRGSVKVCSTRLVGKNKKKKKTCHRIAIFSGHNADRSKLRTEPLERPSGQISVMTQNFGGESLDINIYQADGSFDEAALAKLDDIFRCKRSNEVRAVDPRLYEMMSRIYDHFDHQPIELVSGFRFTERDSSRHHHASAMDIRIKGVSIQDMYAYAESLDAGGMGVGLYPTSQFIHFDFRAPGEPSYRWTDLSGPNSGNSGKGKAKAKNKPGRTKPARKTTS
jgi:uncharacterized protein YcbK (DUF882 family)